MSELLNQPNKARREFAEGTITAHLKKMGFVGLLPKARETAEDAISATLDEIEAFLRANAQGPTGEAEKSLTDLKAEAIKTAAAKVFATLEKTAAHLEKMGLLGSHPCASCTEAPEPSAAPQEEPVPPPQEQVTPACHPQLLKAFGILMRRVGAPPEEGAPGPVQKAVMGLAEVLAEGSKVSVENFFDWAHMEDVKARRAKLDAKITRGGRPTKHGK